ncbi:MAG: hypothetical protein JW789_00535 [Candidatus Aenigmarchaeota archaeon]|nr:hypothetical protein [Candidatus Aenigmarchaeota archaeon]
MGKYSMPRSTTFSDVDINSYVESFFRAYNAIDMEFNGDDRMRELGKKGLDNTLIRNFGFGRFQIPFTNGEDKSYFNGTDDENMILESKVSIYIGDFEKKAFDLGVECKEKDASANADHSIGAKLFETVCAGIQKMRGFDPNEYRKKIRDSENGNTNPEMASALDRGESKLN